MHMSLVQHNIDKLDDGLFLKKEGKNLMNYYTTLQMIISNLIDSISDTRTPYEFDEIWLEQINCQRLEGPC